MMRYAEAEPELDQLLRGLRTDTGPRRRRIPFHHLQTDGLWVVTRRARRPRVVAERAPTSGRTRPPRARVRSMSCATIRRWSRSSPTRCSTPTSPSRFTTISARQPASTSRRSRSVPRRAQRQQLRRRDPLFRELVLVAYEYRCAMCGYDGRLGTQAVGLDAAHLRWWAFDGPDTVDNGLCLCSFHHKLLDRGVLGITDDHEVAVSAHFVGRGRAAEELVLRLVGQPLLDPQPGQPTPGDEPHRLARRPGLSPARPCAGLSRKHAGRSPARARAGTRSVRVHEVDTGCGRGAGRGGGGVWWGRRQQRYVD